MTRFVGMARSVGLVLGGLIFSVLGRRTAVAAAIGAIVALTPAAASGAVPAASWYWSLLVPAANANVLLLGTGHGLYRSTDAGATWHSTGPAGLDATSLAESGGTILAAGVDEPPLASPTLVTGGAYVVAAGRPVFAESTDGGSTWRLVEPKGLPPVGVQALAVEPANDRVVDAVLRNGAVYQSTDGGASFALVTAKIGGTPWTLAITGAGHLVAGDMTTGSYLSANATGWQHTAFVDPKGGHMVMEYAVAPGDPNHVLMTSYGVLSSTDAGKTWHPSLNSKLMFGPVAWAPGSTDVAYAVGWDRSLWRTDDGGKTWAKVS
jgi:photosystem II stability/assembly factor-like uncharacterized protein